MPGYGNHSVALAGLSVLTAFVDGSSVGVKGAEDLGQGIAGYAWRHQALCLCFQRAM